MSRRVIVGCLVVAIGSLVGCTGTGLKTAEGQSSTPLIFGPEAATAAPELAPKEASVACATAGAGFEKAGMVDDAIAQYEKARRHDPEGQKGLCRRLAVLYDLKGDFNQAATEYERALQLMPNDADLMNDLGYSYYSRGEWAKAEQQFAKATQLAPAHKKAWTNRGLALAMLGRSDESLQCFKKVVSEAEARSNLAFLLASQGQTEAAKAEYRQALSLAPELHMARGALDALENPHRGATPGSETPSPTKSAAKKEVRVPSIKELEERLKLESDYTKPISIDPTRR